MHSFLHCSLYCTALFVQPPEFCVMQSIAPFSGHRRGSDGICVPQAGNEWSTTEIMTNGTFGPYSRSGIAIDFGGDELCKRRISVDSLCRSLAHVAPCVSTCCHARNMQHVNSKLWLKMVNLKIQNNHLR